MDDGYKIDEQFRTDAFNIIEQENDAVGLEGAEFCSDVIGEWPVWTHQNANDGSWTAD